ncbi:hypothetical protein [Streptomyces sp. NPDC001165]
MPTEDSRPEGEAYDLALQRWAHEHHDYYGEGIQEAQPTPPAPL